MKGALWIVLNDESRELVRKFCPPIYPKIFIDHVTLQYNVELPEEYKPLIDTKQTVLLKENCHNDKIQAILVDIDLKTKNKFAHITISAKEGVKPIESNQMLESEHISQIINGDIKIYGVVKFIELRGGQKSL